MTILNRRDHGEAPNRNGSPVTPDDVTQMQDILLRLYAADTILRFASKQPILDASMRRRLNDISGHLMMELSLLNAELAGLGVTSGASE